MSYCLYHAGGGDSVVVLKSVVSFNLEVDVLSLKRALSGTFRKATSCQAIPEQRCGWLIFPSIFMSF